jgi:hypothetical protein
MRRSQRGTRVAACLLMVMLSAGCSTFATVRPAEVTPGPRFTVQATMTTMVPDEAAWFWSFDCASDCGRTVPAVGIEYMHGLVETGTPIEVGAGFAGVFPYARAYFQLGRGSLPWGAGLELGMPLDNSWHEHRLFGRMDVPLKQNTRLLLNSSLFLHAGNSPNGQNPGSFVAFVPAAGVQLRGRRTEAIPSVALVVGRGTRESYGTQLEPFNAVFAIVSMSLTVHRARQ